jgi:hypothetical protein
VYFRRIAPKNERFCLLFSKSGGVRGGTSKKKTVNRMIISDESFVVPAHWDCLQQHHESSLYRFLSHAKWDVENLYMPPGLFWAGVITKYAGWQPLKTMSC